MLQLLASCAGISPLSSPNPAAGGALFKGGWRDHGLFVIKGGVVNTMSTDILPTLTLHSLVFGSGSDKYFLLSALNGFRIILILSTAYNAFHF